MPIRNRHTFGGLPSFDINYETAEDRSESLRASTETQAAFMRATQAEMEARRSAYSSAMITATELRERTLGRSSQSNSIITMGTPNQNPDLYNVRVNRMWSNHRVEAEPRGITENQLLRAIDRAETQLATHAHEILYSEGNNMPPRRPGVRPQPQWITSGNWESQSVTELEQLREDQTRQCQCKHCGYNFRETEGCACAGCNRWVCAGHGWTIAKRRLCHNCLPNCIDCNNKLRGDKCSHCAAYGYEANRDKGALLSNSFEPVKWPITKLDHEDKPLLFGIELESQFTNQAWNSKPISVPGVYKLLTPILGTTFLLKSDGSIGARGVEIVLSPYSLAAITPKLKPMCEALIKNEMVSHVGGECGLHIALDRAWFKHATEIPKLKLFFSKCKSQLTLFSRREYRDLDRYAPFACYNGGRSFSGDSGKMRAINDEHSKRVEVRIFRGTLNSTTLLASVQLLDAICHYTRGIGFEKLAEMPELWNCFVRWFKDRGTYPELRTYVDRIMGRDKVLTAMIERSPNVRYKHRLKCGWIPPKIARKHKIPIQTAAQFNAGERRRAPF